MQTPVEAHKKITEVWRQYYPEVPSRQDIDLFLEQSAILDKFQRSNLRTVIFGYNDFAIYHINAGAARYFGSDPDEISQIGALWIIGCFEEDQAKVIVEDALPLAKLMDELSLDELKRTNVVMVNWRINCPRGNKHRSLFHLFPILFDQNNKPLLGMYVIHDLEPFVIKETWWCRYQLGDKVYVRHSEDSELVEGDILTHRELDILHQLYNGESSKEIATKLFLSANTVDNHRRNMLKKTGAVDTSSLIHLCKLCQLI